MGTPAERTPAQLRALIKGLQDRDLLRQLALLCREYNVLLEDVLSRKRYTRIVQARDACINRLAKLSMSTTEIGVLMGMDHSSICAARARYKKRDNGKLLT